MAEETGALNAIKDSSAPAVEAQPDFARDALAKIQKERAEFDAIAAQDKKRYEDLLASLDSRRNRPFNPMLMKLAAGMLRPTKTGSFGESLGYAAEGMSDQAEKDFAQQQQDAKLRFELESKISEQKKQEISRKASQDILSGVGFGGTSSAPAALPILPVPSADGEAVNSAKAFSVEPPVIVTRGDGTSIAPPAPAAPYIEKVAAAPAKAESVKPESVPSPIDAAEESFQFFTKGKANVRAAIKKIAPEAYEAYIEEEKRRLDAAKAGREERETLTKEQVNIEVGGVKAVMSKAENQRRLDLIDKGDIEGADKIHRKHGLPSYFVKMENGKYRAKSPAEFVAEAEAAKQSVEVPQINYFLPEVNDNIPMDKAQAMEYRAAKKRANEDGGVSLQKWYDDNFPELGITVKKGKPAKVDAKTNTITVNDEKLVVPVVGKRPIGEAAGKQWDAEQESYRRLAEKRAEADLSIQTSGPLEEKKAIAVDNIKRDVSTATDIKNSYPLIQNAESLLSLMTNKETKGAWGYWSNPDYKDAFINFVKDGVRAGNYSLGIPALGEALRQAGMTTDELNASARAAQIYGEMKTQIAQKAMDGQGSVSNYERSLVVDISAGLDTPLKAAMASAELMKYRGLFDQQSGELYNKWREANPGIASSKFVLSEQYKALQKDYDKSMIGLREKYFSTSKPAAKPAAPANAAKNTDIPPAGSLVEGSNTTFSNGEVWTLEKGKPKRVR